MAERICPTDDNILVKRDQPEAATPGGIILPDVARDRPTRGTIIATGPGHMLDSGTRADMWVSAGQTVLIAGYGGTTVMIDNEPHVIMCEADVLAIIREE